MADKDNPEEKTKDKPAIKPNTKAEKRKAAKLKRSKKRAVKKAAKLTAQQKKISQIGSTSSKESPVYTNSSIVPESTYKASESTEITLELPMTPKTISEVEPEAEVTLERPIATEIVSEVEPEDDVTLERPIVQEAISEVEPEDDVTLERPIVPVAEEPAPIESVESVEPVSAEAPTSEPEAVAEEPAPIESVAPVSAEAIKLASTEKVDAKATQSETVATENTTQPSIDSQVADKDDTKKPQKQICISCFWPIILLAAIITTIGLLILISPSRRTAFINFWNGKPQTTTQPQNNKKDIPSSLQQERFQDNQGNLQGERSNPYYTNPFTNN